MTVAVTEEDGEISSMTLQDYDRTVPLALVVLAFLVVTVLVGRRVGAKSLLGLGLTVVCIFSILIRCSSAAGRRCRPFSACAPM